MGADLKTLGTYLEEFWFKDMSEKNGFLWWDGTVNAITKHYKVSLCTTCMDRLHNIRVTLPKNIADNADYPYVEFVLLDYNSSDNLGDWVRSEMMQHIESGKLAYYRTEEPLFFDMSHSRNIAFKLASGDIVNNVDADVFVNNGFATYINTLANQCSEKGAFVKSRRLMRGRLGFYKKEFIDLLGGYDEDIKGYGHDDKDLFYRACGLGFKLLWFGGGYHGNVADHTKHQGIHYKEHWKITEGRNKLICATNLLVGKFKANEGKPWGKARVIKNFVEEMEI